MGILYDEASSWHLPLLWCCFEELAEYYTFSLLINVFTTSLISAQGDWKDTRREREHNWFNVTDLEFGRKYEFAVVALNRNNDSMMSKPEYIIVGYTAGLIKIFLMHFGSQP